MKLWLVSNTKFGYKNNNPEWLTNQLNYFRVSFIPLLQKNFKPDDKLIHCGNLFANTDQISTNTLNLVQDLFEEISNIIPVIFLVSGNDIPSGYKTNKNNSLNVFKHFKNIKICTEPILEENILYLPWTKTPIRDLNNTSANIIIMSTDYLNYNCDLVKQSLKDKISFCGFYDNYQIDDAITTIGSPYQFEKTSDKKGIIVYDINKSKTLFVDNKTSPKFKTITITTEEDIKDLDADYINKNYVSVIVDQSLIESKKIKIDILLSQYNFQNINYINKKVDELEVSTESWEVVELCREQIKKANNSSLMAEFEKIVKLKQERY